MKLGDATLFLQTINSGIEEVKITYAVTFTSGESLVSSHKLMVGSDSIPRDGEMTVSVNGDGIEYPIELVADIGEFDDLSDQPSIEYTITITVTPA